MNYADLKAELQKPAYAGVSDAEAAAALNTKNIPTYTAVETALIKKYIFMADRLLPLKQAADAGVIPAIVVLTALEFFQALDTNEQAVRDKMSDTMNALVSQGIITVQDRDIINSFAVTQISRADELGFGAITPEDVRLARARQ